MSPTSKNVRGLLNRVDNHSNNILDLTNETTQIKTNNIETNHLGESQDHTQLVTKRINISYYQQNKLQAIVNREYIDKKKNSRNIYFLLLIPNRLRISNDERIQMFIQIIKNILIIMLCAWGLTT